MCWRHLSEVQWDQAYLHAQAEAVKDSDGDKHRQVWRSCSPCCADHRETGRRCECFLSSDPVCEPGLGDGSKRSPGGEESIDGAQDAGK